MVDWDRGDIEKYHSHDPESKMIKLENPGKQCWWVIDKLNGTASVWRKLDSNEEEVRNDFERQVEALGIDPSLYDEIQVVSEDELYSISESEGQDRNIPETDEYDNQRYDATTGWDFT